MATKIVTKNSSTASAVPTASDLVQGELAVNVADKRLFTEDNGGAIVELGTNPSGNVTFQDNGKAIFGAGSDLQIYHDGNNSFVADEGTGALVLQSNGSFTLIQNSSGVANARFDSAGATSLRYNGAEKLATTSTGIDVTGNLQATGYLAVDGASGNTGAGTDRWIGGDGTAGTWFYNVPTGSNHYFAVNNANKLAINSTGIDVTGTVTADGLTVDGSTAINNPSSQQITFSRTGSSVGSGTIGADVAQAMGIWDTDNNKVAAFYQNQDVAFYEDTGTTAKLFWDASAESLGIGTSSPATGLHLEHSNAGATSGTIRIQDRDSQQDANQQTGGIEFYTQDATNPTEGVSTAIKSFSASSSGGAYLTLSTTDVNTSTLDERMRIDSSGNVLVGTTSTDPAASSTETGVALKGGGFVSISRNDTAASVNINKVFYDGSIVDFRKNGAIVGSIGTVSGDIRIGGLDDNHASIRFAASSKAVLPVKNSDGDLSDNTTDLGASSARFKDLYLSGTGYFGTSVGIGTSSPAYELDVKSSGEADIRIDSATGNDGALRFAENGTNVFTMYHDAANSALAFYDNANTSERMRIDASGNVKINAAGSLLIRDDGTFIKESGGLQIGNTSGTGTTRPILFYTESAERMRIDSSGNLLVGKTSSSFDTQGVAFRGSPDVGASGATFTRDDDNVAAFNRLNSDGSILTLNKDGASVGSIGTSGGDLYIGTGDTALRFLDASDFIYPVSTATGTSRDNAIDLGYSTGRFRNIYLSGGIQLGGVGAANKLDDYEEGTWSPEIVGSTTAGSYSGTIKVGSYTKVGQVVSVWGYFLGSSGTGAGDLNISGLPFTVASDAVGVIQGNSGLVYPSGTTDACLYGSGGTTLSVRCNKSNGTVFSNMTYPTSATYIRFTLSYKTT